MDIGINLKKDHFITPPPMTSQSQFSLPFQSPTDWPLTGGTVNNTKQYTYVERSRDELGQFDLAHTTT